MTDLHPNFQRYRDATNQLEAAIIEVLAACDGLDDGFRTEWGTMASTNFPEALREALWSLAAAFGSDEALIRHRPGCWEAQHVLALTNGWDWGLVRDEADVPFGDDHRDDEGPSQEHG